MAQFKRRPNTLFPFEANRYEREGQDVLGMKTRDDGSVYVTTVQGRDVGVGLGEWVIQEPDGEHYYPCQNDVFQERYEPAD